jgi:long-chain acyl-CoA synthetase
MQVETTAARLLQRARRTPDVAAYFTKREGRWRPTSWREYAEQTRQVARALVALGLEAGQATCILGFNRPEWVLMELGTSLAAGLPVGIYTTNAAGEVQYIAHHCGARVLLVEDEEQWRKVQSVRGELPHLRYVVLMAGAEAPATEVLPGGPPVETLSWNAFLAKGDEVPEAVIEERRSSIQADDLGTLIYTSGTTGPPKGVMLSHNNLSWTARHAVVDLLGLHAQDTLVSYLPLSHIAERMFSVHAAVAAGYAVYFAESGEKVPENLREVQPTLIFGVPRVWERMYSAVSARLADARGLKAWIARWAMGIGRRISSLRAQGGVPGPWLEARYRLADRLFFRKVKPLLGLANARYCVSGAAPISIEILEFFAGLDLLIREVYGQSEDTGPTSFNQIGKTRLGTVGPAIPGVEVKIAEDGEVLVRGPNVFLGYYKDPEATAETLVDGWLHSGDLGSLDADGYLTITGRKKEILITSGGKNISPNNLEASLKDLELVGDAMVVGDGRRFLTAILTLEPEKAEQLAAQYSVEAEALGEHPEVVAAVQAGVDEVNAHYARVQQIRAFRIVPGAFSVDGGELTPTLKLKRRVVEERYRDEIEAMYGD